MNPVSVENLRKYLSATWWRQMHSNSSAEEWQSPDSTMRIVYYPDGNLRPAIAAIAQYETGRALIDRINAG